MIDAGFSYAVLTISDAGSKGERDDRSGDAIVSLMSEAGFTKVDRGIVPDEKDQISERLRHWCDAATADVIVTTGGTGLGPRDVTPEATRAVVDIEVPGIAEAMRIETLKHTPFAMLSRAVVGIRNGCLIVNLPGSPSGVRETLEVAVRSMPHALEMIRGWRTHPGP